MHDVLTLQNGNGEIDPEEMEDIFTKLCKAGQAIKLRISSPKSDIFLFFYARTSIIFRWMQPSANLARKKLYKHDIFCIHSLLLVGLKQYQVKRLNLKWGLDKILIIFTIVYSNID